MKIFSWHILNETPPSRSFFYAVKYVLDTHKLDSTISPEGLLYLLHITKCGSGKFRTPNSYFFLLHSLRILYSNASGDVGTRVE